MRIVGHIDIETYRCIADDITTDEVIITDERISHIKERHPGHLEILEPYIQLAVHEPDFILEDSKPNTGLILKLIEQNGLRIQIVLRVHTSNDVRGFKNSIISA